MKFFSILSDTNTPHRFEQIITTGPFRLFLCARCGCYGKTLMQTCPLKILDEEEKLIPYEIFIGSWQNGLHKHATIVEYNEVAEMINDNILDTHNKQVK